MKSHARMLNMNPCSMFVMIPFRGKRQGVQNFHPVVGTVQELSAPAPNFGERMKGPSDRTVRAVTGNSGVRCLSDGGSLSRVSRCFLILIFLLLWLDVTAAQEPVREVGRRASPMPIVIESSPASSGTSGQNISRSRQGGRKHSGGTPRLEASGFGCMDSRLLFVDSLRHCRVREVQLDVEKEHEADLGPNSFIRVRALVTRLYCPLLCLFSTLLPKIVVLVRLGVHAPSASQSASSGCWTGRWVVVAVGKVQELH